MVIDYDVPAVVEYYSDTGSGGGGSGIWDDDGIHPAFDTLYPYQMGFPPDVDDISYEWKPTGFEYPETGDLISSIPDLAGEDVIALKAYRYSGVFLPGDTDVCYYVLYHTSTAEMLVRMTQDDVEYLLGAGMFDPFNPILDFNEGTGFLSFLHDFGQVIITNNPLPDVLGVEINGMSFLALLFGSGFLLFAIWTVGKWLI